MRRNGRIRFVWFVSRGNQTRTRTKDISKHWTRNTNSNNTNINKQMQWEISYFHETSRFLTSVGLSGNHWKSGPSNETQSSEKQAEGTFEGRRPLNTNKKNNIKNKKKKEEYWPSFEWKSFLSLCSKEIVRVNVTIVGNLVWVHV